MKERNNHVNRCDRHDCTRATFVETERGISANFWHNGKHQQVYTVEQMIHYLAARGFVVVESAVIIEAARLRVA